MSEKQTSYNAGQVPPETMAALKGRPCTLPYSDPNYQHPTPEDVTALIQIAGWSQREAALIVGATYNPKKGSTTIRKWRTKKECAEYREIPYSAWRLLLLAAGAVSIGDDLVTLNNYGTKVAE